MPRKIDLPKGGWAELAEEDELTVQGQWDIEHAGDAQQAAVAVYVQSQARELRAILETISPDERQRWDDDLAALKDKRLKAPQRKAIEERLALEQTIRVSRANVIASDRLADEEKAAVDRFDVVRALAFLRDWSLGPVPATVEEFIATTPNLVLVAITAALDGVDVTPTNFNKSAEGIMDPKAPTSDSAGSKSPGGSSSGKTATS